MRHFDFASSRGLAFSLVALNTVDAVSTLVAVKWGFAHEANPLMKFLVEMHPEWFLWVKFFVGNFIMLHLGLRADMGSRRAYWSLVAMVVFYSVIFVEHMRIWWLALSAW